MTDEDRKHGKGWVRYGLLALCGVLLAADAMYHKHAKLAVEEWFGFYAIYGLIASVVLVLIARAVHRLIMRPEDYYGGDDD